MGTPAEKSVVTKNTRIPALYRENTAQIISQMGSPRWSPDEKDFLVSLRELYPSYSWEEFTSLYNSVTLYQHRSVDAIKKKINELVSCSRTFIA